tara:strand:+ start:1524 stop:3533 length:2010 start_codon:yes stop_codon:yes gene_type:complete
MRADTSGILRGAAMGGQAIGQGLASMASGLNKGIQKNTELDQLVKQTASQAKNLAEYLPEGSEFKAMAQGASDFLNDPENRRSEKIAAARAFEPNLKMVSMNLDASMRKQAMEIQKNEVARQKSQREGASRGLADLVASEGNRDALAEISIASMKELQGDPEATAAYKSSALQGLLSIEQSQRKSPGSITTLSKSVDGSEVGREAGKTYTYSAFQQNGQIIPGTVSITPKERAGVLSPKEALQQREAVASQDFDQQAQFEMIEKLPDRELAASTYVEALDLLNEKGRNKTYQGMGAELVVKVNQLGAALGIDEAKIKAAKGERLIQIFGDEVMKQINKTKGAVSEKEMKYFALISPGLNKQGKVNRDVMLKQLKFLQREIKVGTLVRNMRNEGKTVSEIAKAVGDFRMENLVVPLAEMQRVIDAAEAKTTPAKSKRQVSQDAMKMLQGIRAGNPTQAAPAPPQMPPEQGSSPVAPTAPAQPQPGPTGATQPASSQFNVLTVPRDTAAARLALKDAQHVVSTDFNSGAEGKRAPAPGIEIVVPRNATPQIVQAAKDYLSQTENFMRSRGVKTAIRKTGKNKDGILYKGATPRFIYTEPFFKSDAASRKAIEKDGAGYAQILANTLGRLPGVSFIPPHKKNDKGAAIRGTNINEQDWSMRHVIPHLLNLKG